MLSSLKQDHRHQEPNDERSASGAPTLESHSGRTPPPVSTPGVAPGVVLKETYRIVRLVAAGGIGAVYEAEHVRLHRTVAIKVLQERFAHDEMALDRFYQEAEVVGQLGHPHIVQVFDMDRAPSGEPYLVMEFLRGETLAERLDRESFIPVSSAVHIASQIAGALAETHTHGVVHRDLKPANVFLVQAAGTEDFVKILDFGISKVSTRRQLTEDLTAVGTPNYMAPEQAQGLVSSIDHRTDQFALAALIYEMLTGRVAFDAGDIPTVMYRVVHVEPPPLTQVAAWIPANLEPVLERALSKRPADRYPTISQFAWALENAARAAGAFGSVPAMRPSEELEVPETGSLQAPRVPSSEVPRQPRSEAPLMREDPIASGPPTNPSTPRLSSSLGPGARAHALVLRAKEALDTGELDSAVSFAEQLFELAVDGKDPSVLRALAPAVPLLDQIFERRVGAPGQVLRAGPTEPSTLQLSPRAAALLARFEGGARINVVMRESGIPRRDLMRMLAGLLRRGALAGEDA